MEKIIDKIRKLLRLSDRNSNDNERNAALEKAMAMLAEHNLSMSQIDIEEKAGIKVEKNITYIRCETWRDFVSYACGMLYYCGVYNRLDGNTRRAYCFYGKKENTEVAIGMTNYLIDSIQKEANRRFETVSDRRSFRCGAGSAIYTRAKELIEAEKSASTAQSTALVVLRDELIEANKDFEKTLCIRPSQSRSFSVSSESAYEAGEGFGNSLGLNRLGQLTPA